MLKFTYPFISLSLSHCKQNSYKVCVVLNLYPIIMFFLILTLKRNINGTDITCFQVNVNVCKNLFKYWICPYIFKWYLIICSFCQLLYQFSIVSVFRCQVENLISLNRNIEILFFSSTKRNRCCINDFFFVLSIFTDDLEW